MMLRGYHEHFHYADIDRFKARDALFMVVCILFFLMLRYGNISQLIGGLVV